MLLVRRLTMRNSHLQQFRRFALGVLALASAMLGFSQTAKAQLPTAQLTAISPLSAQQGTSLEMTVTGTDLDLATEVVFSHPGILARRKLAPPLVFRTKPEVVPNVFAVTVAPDVPPGVYDARVAGKFGVSNPKAFLVTSLNQIKDPGGNNTKETALPLPINSAISGTADGNAVDWYQLEGKQGQRIVIDCWAQRIDSRMDPTLVLYDSAGKEVAQSRDAVRRDALLDYAVPADGKYLLKVHDFTFLGGPEYGYHLSASTLPYIDFIMPPSGIPGTTSVHTIYGRNLPGGTPAQGVTVAGRMLEKLDVNITFPAVNPQERFANGGIVSSQGVMLDGFDYRGEFQNGMSNPYFLGSRTEPVILEIEPNDTAEAPQTVTLPAEIAGQFQKVGDIDQYVFEGKAGELYYLDLISQRLGQPTDPHVTVQKKVVSAEQVVSWTDVAVADDNGEAIGGFAFYTPNDDPYASVSIPTDGTYRIVVDNLSGSSVDDPRLVYRLILRKGNPDFRLVAAPIFPSPGKAEARPWNVVIRSGGTDAADVYVSRRDGFAGPIELSVEGLPPNIKALPAVIAPGQSSATIIFQAQDNSSTWRGNVRVLGRATIGGNEVVREARSTSVLVPVLPNIAGQSRLNRGLFVSVVGTEPAPFIADVGQGQIFEMAAPGKLQIPVKLTRRGEIKGNITLTALGLPPNVAPDALAFDPNTNEGNLGLQVNPGTPPGEYTIWLQSQAVIGYRRNVELSEAANAYKADVDKLIGELTPVSQAAEAAKQQADQAAAAAMAALQQATDAAGAAKTASTTAADEVKALTEKVAQAKAAAEADKNNQDLANAATQAQQQLTESETRAKTAAEQLAAMDTKLAEAQAAFRIAAETQAKAVKAATSAAEKLKQATDAKPTADQNATNAMNASNPVDLNVILPTTSVTIRILPSPVVTSASGPLLPKPQASKFDVPITVTRKLSYNDAVNIELLPPNGVAGIMAAPLQIPAGQAAGNLVVELAADAPVGTHLLTLRTTVTFNGQAVQTSDVTFPVEVQAK